MFFDDLPESRSKTKRCGLKVITQGSKNAKAHYLRLKVQDLQERLGNMELQRQ